MRVLRVFAGILTLLLALPVLVAGGLSWWAMQHRSPDGAFRASVTPVEAPGRVLVVPDIDAILRRDAPIARAEKTTLRLSANGFIGMAEPADVAAFLAGSGYTTLHGITLGRGPLPTRTSNVNGSPVTDPQNQDFWVRSGSGQLTWTPAVDRGQRLALVVVAATGDEPIRVAAAVTAGWLNSTTWGLLILGPVMLLLGFAALAWPQRPREIVYVMDRPAMPGAPVLPPRQMSIGTPDPAHVPGVPALAAAVGAPAIAASAAGSADVVAHAVPAGFAAGDAVAQAAAADFAGGDAVAGSETLAAAAGSAAGFAADDAAADVAAHAVVAGSVAGSATTAAAVGIAADDAAAAHAVAGGFPDAACSVSQAVAAGSAATSTAGAATVAADAASPADAASSADASLSADGTAPRLPWPPPEQPQATEPARELPMPVAGVHLHLSKRP
jgi:hypothetical protein